MDGRFGLAHLTLGAIILTGCAQGDMRARSVESYYKEHRSIIQQQYEGLLKKKDFNWMFHVHFRGNDLGGQAGDEVNVELAPDSSSPLHSKEHPFNTLTLNNEDGALDLFFNYKHPKILGTLHYRHEGGPKALRAVKHLFGCSSVKEKEAMDKTLFIVSGGSHGGSEAEEFVRDLKKDCGKDVDVVVTGDAIRQPNPWPMSRFNYISDDVPCLNFFQQGLFQILKGQPLSNCMNVKIIGFGDESHFKVEKSGLIFMTAFFKDLDQNN